MANKEKKATAQKPTYSRSVRILALILSILVTGGVLTGLVTLIINLFH